MITLGINISHDFSVCVYENGKIKDFFYEERYNFKKRWKIKNKNCFLLSLFKNINFKPDLVIYSSIQRLNNASISDEEVIHDIQKQLDNPPYYFDKNKHHVYHALSSFYFSKFDEAMSLVIDGRGCMPFNDWYFETQSIFYLNKKLISKIYQHLSNRIALRMEDKIKNLSEYAYKYFIDGTEYDFSSMSLGGYEFERVCKLIDMENEPGKLMGLSSYAYCNEKYNVDYDKVNMAKEVQENTFNETCELIEKAYNYRKIKNFVLSGGYFLNCSNNFKYVKRYPEINFFVDPVPHDGGTAIGACVYNDYK